MFPFTWSWSRSRTYDMCRRRYWFDHYGARDGWRRPVGDRARALYELKTLRTRPQWLGIKVHDAAAWTLQRWREGDDVALDDLVEDTARRARREIGDARRGLHALDPRRHVGFDVLHHGDDPGDAAWEAWVDELGELVRIWWDHPVTRRLAAAPDRIVEVEELQRIVVGAVPVFVALDVLVRDRHGGLTVVDWKSGRHHDPEVVARQLAVYGLYVQRRHRRSGRIIGLEADLRSNGFHRVDLTPTRLGDAADAVHASAQAMASFLTDPDVDAVEEGLFEPLPVDSPPCAHCCYRSVCREDGQKTSA